MKNAIACLTLSLALANTALAFTEPDGLAALDPVPRRPSTSASPFAVKDLRFAVMPLAGNVGGLPGTGIDVSMGLGHGVWGIRLTGAEEFCIMCSATESELQTAFLAGFREEFRAGSISLRTGLAAVKRVAKENFVREGGFFSDPEYDLETFQGVGFPIQVDLQLGGRFIGVNLSITGLMDSDGGSGGIMLGVPVGYLRR